MTGRQRRRGLRAVAALLALSVAAFSFITTETLPVGLLPLIAADLDTSQAAVGRLVSAYGLVVILASVPLTVLVRRIPRRYLISVLLVGYVTGSVLSAVAGSYPLLLASRLLTALAHAVFWSVIAVTATGLFSPARRGRVLSILYSGSGLASVLGVPAGTWIGQQLGWRSAFWTLTTLGLLVLLTVAVTLPTSRPEQSHAARAAHPDHRRYWLLVVTTALAVTGTFTAYTYTVPFLVGEAGFPESAVAPLLTVRGVAGVTGVLASGALLDRWPRGVMIGGVATQAAALTGMFLLAEVAAAVIVTVALTGASLSVVASSLTNRILLVAPGSTDVAAAGGSSAFNVGITGGSFAGSLLLPVFGVASTVLAGGVFSALALAVLASEPLLIRDRRRRGVTAADSAEVPGDPAGQAGAASGRSPADQVTR